MSDFVEAKFAILMILGFFLMTTEFAEIGLFLDQELFTLRAQRLRGEFSSDRYNLHPMRSLRLIFPRILIDDNV